MVWSDLRDCSLVKYYSIQDICDRVDSRSILARQQGGPRISASLLRSDLTRKRPPITEHLYYLIERQERYVNDALVVLDYLPGSHLQRITSHGSLTISTMMVAGRHGLCTSTYIPP